MIPELQPELSALDRAAVLAYEGSLQRTLDDPGRLKAVYSAKFAAAPVRDRIKQICIEAKRALATDGCEANLVTNTSQYDIVADSEFDAHLGMCRWVVSTRNALGVESASTHALVCTSQAVMERGIRSYLGLPLLWDSYAVGSFCVYDSHDREWKPYEVQVLAQLAVTVMDTMHWDG